MGIKEIWQVWQLEREANCQDAIVTRLKEEFGHTGEVGHMLRCQAQSNRLEAKILKGEIIPVSEEYID